MANKWIVAISVTTGAMMAAVDTSVLNIATPHLRGVFSATTSEISWISTGYLLTVVMGMPLSGWVCKHFDRKKVCQGGLFVFIIASMLCCFSTDLNSLILARVLQGMGTGILLPVEQVILRQTFPPKEQGLAMGIYGVTIMIGPAIGPLLGGLIIDHSHWSLIFFINIPIGIAGLLMIERFVPEMPVEASTKSTGNKPDMAGIALLATALFPLLYLLERGDRLDWFETQSNVILLLVFISAITMFCAHELMTLKPAVQLRILANRAFSSAMLMSFVLGIVVAATLFVLPIFMQDVLGYSATDAGMALVPQSYRDDGGLSFGWHFIQLFASSIVDRNWTSDWLLQRSSDDALYPWSRHDGCDLATNPPGYFNFTHSNTFVDLCIAAGAAK